MPDYADVVEDMDETPFCYSFELDDYEGDGESVEDDDE
jgi:hypothetical protein